MLFNKMKDKNIKINNKNTIRFIIDYKMRKGYGFIHEHVFTLCNSILARNKKNFNEEKFLTSVLCKK
jgi:hypothetical protein